MGLKIGDRVLCVDDHVDIEKSAEIFEDFQRWVVKNNEYTVRDILYNDGIVIGVLLEEIYNIPLFIKLIGRCQEPAFGLFRFRKLSSKSTFVEENQHEEVLERLEIK